MDEIKKIVYMIGTASLLFLYLHKNNMYDNRKGSGSPRKQVRQLLRVKVKVTIVSC